MSDTNYSTQDNLKNQTLLSHRQREKKRFVLLIGFMAMCFISLVLDLTNGPAGGLISSLDVLKALLHLEGVDTFTSTIVNDLRLPAALMALVAGAALGAGGAEIQTLLNNPMASPYTLGMAAAAGFGAALVIVFGGFGLPAYIAQPIMAFVMTMLASGVMFAFAAMRRFSSATLVLVGISLLFLFQSGSSLIQYLSTPEDSQKILFWLFGSLSKATHTTLAITTCITAICLWLLYQSAWQLTALRLGESRAISLGINLTRLRLKVLVIVAIMTATVISFIGTIGFIGLVSPHVARTLVGEDQRYFLPASALCGAAFLSCASVLSETLKPGAIFPIGIITSIIGVPFFFWIILSKRGH
ncbi:MAG: iron ABC transporter permease [Cardiobacteriaceae bacterium]|nr:iron ABC transporter permease [Cardiobacteriaceae bacterium]